MYKIPANTVFLGKKLHYLPSCHSTNDVALRLIREKYPEGCVVITDEQYAGKGQKGNTWETEPGQNLTFSIILYPEKIKPSRQFDLTRITTLGITDFLKDFLQVEATIKWPNDIFYNHKKIAGILINTSISGSKLIDAVVGIGLNVNQEKFSLSRASSLSMITGRSYNLQTVLEGLLLAIEQRYSSVSSIPSRKLETEYLQRMMGINQLLPFYDRNREEQIEGIIRGVDESGRLKVEVGKEIRKYSFKEIEYTLS